MKMKEIFLKHSSRELSEQTICRLRYNEDRGDFQGTEMLIIGYLMNSGMSYAVYNLKYKEQYLFTDSEYQGHWSSIRGWLVEIDEAEFKSLYYQAIDLILDTPQTKPIQKEF